MCAAERAASSYRYALSGQAGQDRRSGFERSMPSDLIRGWKPVRVEKTRQPEHPETRFDFIETEKALDRASAVQHKSSLKARARGAGRNAGVGLGASGMIVMVHAAGTLDLFSTIDRTWPVTADPAERTVAVLPLNWAIRKRRTSF
jgi:hypothetical protein